ncbi:hypothetical protein Pmani_019170 [Petrolisthes manimaculis]|uniref:Uncharacterized protein n=1 Tax=Petrolisthes manimaculis TaxID=1843537 RepID=A0AAE1PJG0_9EUCA|nr:hypothetical protein Pmani_019170 [Petrolisthes manimaculis]
MPGSSEGLMVRCVCGGTSALNLSFMRFHTLRLELQGDGGGGGGGGMVERVKLVVWSGVEGEMLVVWSGEGDGGGGMVERVTVVVWCDVRVDGVVWCGVVWCSSGGGEEGDAGTGREMGVCVGCGGDADGINNDVDTG